MKPMRITRLAILVYPVFFGLSASAFGALPAGLPEQLGMDAVRLARVDAVVENAIKDRQVPGAVVLVGRRGRIAYARAFGRRVLVPREEPMTRDTLFDLASLTKPVATATSVMILIEEGKLRLDDRLGRLLPEFDNHGKGAITIEQLLRHRAGLIADNPIGDFADGSETAWKRLAELELAHTPGASYVYSDIGFMILGRLVEKVSGQSLDDFARDHIFSPLGMGDTLFRPARQATLEGRVAPTEAADGSMLRGLVHDPRARALGGVAGHAGLFGTADDLAVFAQALLDGGLGPNGRRVLGPLTVRAMTDPGSTPPGQKRGLGWDVATPQSAPRGGLFGPEGFGHTGFTGTSLWVDPTTSTFVVILTSRLHPDGKAPSPTGLRYEVATVVASSIIDLGRDGGPKVAAAVAAPESGAPREVLCGIDVLVRDHFAPLKFNESGPTSRRRIGLVTNHTGRTREGASTIDVLFKASGVELVALFSPEHGIRGAVDAEVADSRDEATSLPIFSLYSKTRKPTQESLKAVDALVYDIQDIGARYYTYISTLGLVLEAARERGIPVYVLDRPNPIGGIAVAGPVRDQRFASFIAYHELPVRHGMTVGELAALFNTERKIGAELHVVPCEGWRRGDLFDSTGLLWVNPSPNMRSLTEALLYPGIGLLEASNLATGRGTDTPFERVGAPWIDPRAFSTALNALGQPGVRFVPIRFTPTERQYAGQECGGVSISITDRDRFEPVALGIGMARVLRSLYPNEWKPDGFLRMLADEAAYRALLDGRTVREIEAVWQSELADFLQVRAKYLLY
jgi:uncharacterized protein YbbC (DUF1343 family)/CubicO group peptidase (beta-lactamase class C family)